jgi:hypothetical protein
VRRLEQHNADDHMEIHLELGKQRKVTVFYIFYIKRRIRIFNTKNLYGNNTNNFVRKTCYDYFQAYDVTLICSILVRILYSNYMFYNKENI